MAQTTEAGLIVGMLELSKKDLEMIRGGKSEAVLGGEHGDLIAKITEAGFNDLLDLVKESAEKAFVLNWEGSKVPRGVKINGREIAWTQNGVVQDTDGRMIGTYDRLMEYGGENEKSQCMVIYTGTESAE